MKTRLFNQNESINLNHLACLNGNDVISAQVSDHHPMIHDGVLFWNIMMRGSPHNNGFGLTESIHGKRYHKRLSLIADVIAEIVFRHPAIDIISLCEGPIELTHVNTFFQSLKKHDSMNKFIFDNNIDNVLHKPTIKNKNNWGLLMLADKSYQVKQIQGDYIEQYPELFDKLANRFHVWRLTKNGQDNYLALAHFPFKADVEIVDSYITQKNKLSTCAKKHCDLVKNILTKYKNNYFILCGDFNLNPYLIGEWQDHLMDHIQSNNSILLSKENKTNTVTVDGILLSHQEKRRYYSLQFNPGLFSRLKKENDLLQYQLNKHDQLQNTDETSRKLG